MGFANVLAWWSLRNGIWIICYHIDRFNTPYVSCTSNPCFLQTSEGVGDLFSSHKCKYFIYGHKSISLTNQRHQWKNIIYKISVVWTHIVGQQLTCKFRIVWKKAELSYVCDPVDLSECKTSSRLSAALTALMLIAFIGFAEPSSGI